MLSRAVIKMFVLILKVNLLKLLTYMANIVYLYKSCKSVESWSVKLYAGILNIKYMIAVTIVVMF